MTDSAGTACPSCKVANPLGARFCSACRTPLVAQAPTPPAPPRPSLGGMVGQVGGKAQTTQVAADPVAAHAHIKRYLEALPGTEVAHGVGTQQIQAKVAYKDFIATAGLVIKVDTTVDIAPAGAGQSTITVTTKVDSNSTGKLWMIMGTCAVFLVITGGMFWMQRAVFAALALGLGWWIINSRPGSQITEALFDDIKSNAARLQSAPVATTEAPAAEMPSPPPAEDRPQPRRPSGVLTEDQIFERIRRLAELRDADAISTDDFEAKKQELLAQI